ncbi:type II toxin-antitoxin system HicA family toxin [Acidiplasma sp.]|uniref:type II toxin-antitoxin system HicA family toxin n=1 Tax=Acidiplasma sp. TaxID=1872114 RepID=UPI0025847F2B|nr:type II toxin-antitoxin system HicA family toxin [Acidiplasma sp.]
MPKLPVLSGRDVIKALSKIGYSFDHQTGSHVILINEKNKRITVPLHDEIGKGLLKVILKQAGISMDEFSKLLK